MPALFAYLLAVGLLLGGGYGALSWLTAPEPVKVVVKAKPKQPPRDEASSEATSFETSSLALNGRDHAASGAKDPPSPARSEARVAARERGGQPQSSEPASAPQSRVEAKISSAGAPQEVG